MKRVLILFCLALFFISFASGQIIFYDEPEGLYSLGDSIFANFSIDDSGVADYVESYLMCGSNEFIVKKEYVLISSEEEYFGISFPAPINGDCRLFAKFKGYEKSTNEFKISNKILIDYSYSFAEDKISISGSAGKENGDFFEGEINIVIGSKNFTTNAFNGNFSDEFNFENIFPGDYDLVVSAEDSFLNSGKEIKKIHIQPKPTSISIGFDGNSSFAPPKDFHFNVSLLDQSGNLISNESVLIKIFSPLNKEIVSQETILSGRESDYLFKNNATLGGWSINAYFGNIFSPLGLDVGANREVSVIVEDDKIHIVNTGNIDYVGNVVFNLKNNNFSEDVSLNISIPLEKHEIVYGLNELGFQGNYTLSFEGEEFSITGHSIFFTDELSPRSYVIGFLILGIFVLGFLFRKKLAYGLKYGFGKKNKNRESFPGKVKKKSEKVVSAKINSKRVNACMVFLEFSRFVEMDDLFEAYGFSFKPVGEGLGYVLFYSAPEKNPEKKMFNFARSAKRFANEKGAKVSFVINSMPFRGMDEVKDFASFNRKLLQFSDGEIFISKNVCKKIGISHPKNVKKFKVDSEEVEVCVL
ncbi:MAG: hypothetical protein PVJ67_03070 [Candidatus Pacearchaeota archaeon]|jgi:hypothetical protein